MVATSRCLFSLGKICATPGAIEAFQRTGQQPTDLIRRHQSGDWGDLCPEDRRLNDAAVAHEGNPERQVRVLSAYILADQTKVWIITEWDRSVTTLLLPSEY